MFTVMFKLLAPIVAVLHLADGGRCPQGYELYSKGQCRSQVSAMSIPINEINKDAVSVCQKVGAIPLTIHDQKDNEYYASKYTGRIIVLGLSCNKTNGNYQWSDGSALDYYPPNKPSFLNSSCVDGYVYYMHANGLDGFWYQNNGPGYSDADIYCVYNLEPEVQSCDHDVCYWVVQSAGNWSRAQMICKEYGGNIASIHSAQSNSYIRRFAVANGLVNGIRLGAAVGGKSNNYTWIDGSSWDYENFDRGFPKSGFGECLAMNTDDTAGKWINVDCGMNLPVVCEYQTTTAPFCPEGDTEEEQLLTSPMFPEDASVPCDFFLSVGSGKQIEIEINMLEANTCCDRVLIFEGFLGGQLIANISGEVSSKMFYTKSTTARVSWQPKGGENVRGLMFQYRGFFNTTVHTPDN